jgi:hypothetical protein
MRSSFLCNLLHTLLRLTPPHEEPFFRRSAKVSPSTSSITRRSTSPDSSRRKSPRYSGGSGKPVRAPRGGIAPGPGPLDAELKTEIRKFGTIASELELLRVSSADRQSDSVDEVIPGGEAIQEQRSSDPAIRNGMGGTPPSCRMQTITALRILLLGPH